jgi:tetratricopeptide (TPR) repeat protein
LGVRHRLAVVIVGAALLAGCATKGAPAGGGAPVTGAPGGGGAPVTGAPGGGGAPVTAPSPPSPGQGEYETALGLLARGDFLGAASHLKQAVKLDPALAGAWNDLSYTLLRSDGINSHPSPPPGGIMYKDAADAARKALALKPDWAHAQYNLGLALLADGQYAEAEAPLRRSAEQQAERPEPRAALGLALLGAGRADEAIAACRQAKQVQPDYGPAAECLLAAGDGFRRLPQSEAAIGLYRYEPGKGFRWTGKPGAGGQPELVRISPPWTCAYRYPDGFQESFIGCRGDGWVYAWTATQAGAGKTPSGVGVGSAMAEAVKIYGESVNTGKALYYQVGELHLAIRSMAGTTVDSLVFSPVSPYWLIDSLMHEGIPRPAGQ